MLMLYSKIFKGVQRSFGNRDLNAERAEFKGNQANNCPKVHR